MQQNQSFNPDIRTEVIEILVSNAGAGEFSLGSLPNLRDAKRIISIESFDVTQITVTPSGKPVVAAAVMQKCYLRLINAANVDLRQVPLRSISKTINGTIVPPVNCGPIDPEKSKILVPNAGAALTVNDCFLLNVIYEKRPEKKH